MIKYLATTDTTVVVAAIKQLIAVGASEREFLAEILRQFPDITSAESSAALQDTAAAAEKRDRRGTADGKPPMIGEFTLSFSLSPSLPHGVYSVTAHYPSAATRGGGACGGVGHMSSKARG